MIIVTLDADGIYTRTNRYDVTVPARPVTVVDTVGAGDSVTGAVLRAFQEMNLLGADNRPALKEIRRGAMETVLGQALEVAAFTVSQAGANPPLLEQVSFGSGASDGVPFGP